MRKKRDYKKINVGFRTQKEYDKFHKEAVKEWGDGRNADCMYIRTCISQNRKRRTKSEKERVIVLVETTQRLNNLLLETDDPYIKEEISDILEEQGKLWVF